jgi:hypothetical protein
MIEKGLKIKNNMTVEEDFIMRVNFKFDDIRRYKICRIHRKENVIKHGFSQEFCSDCHRDHLLLKQLQGLTDLFRDISFTREIRRRS